MAGEKRAATLSELRSRALEIGAEQRISEAKGSALPLEAKLQDAADSIDKAFEQLQLLASAGTRLFGVQRQLFESADIVRMALQNARGSLKKAELVPQVTTADGETVPRAYAAIEKFFEAIDYDFDSEKFSVFFRVFQEKDPLRFAEDWLLIAFAQLLLLDRIRRTIERLPLPTNGANAAHAPETENSVLMGTLITSLRRISEFEPEEIIGAVSEIDRVLRADPAKAYARMDFESREAYCRAVAELAAQSPASEREVAEKAVELAGAPPAAATRRGMERRSHVGFYVIREGRKILGEAIGYRAAWPTRLRAGLLRSADLIYLMGIELATMGVIALALVAAHGRLPGSVELLLFLLPALECAVATVNILSTQFVSPRALPKMDFSKGIAEECATVVAIPTLLISEEQTRKMVNDLEVRYLANRDRNLYFALITDPPDSVKQFDEKDQLAPLCAELVKKLNEKYAEEGRDSFFHFHRNRVYNATEKMWMGWERKRGKLLDFNRLLLGQENSFTLKTGDLSVLSKIKYVITLDADTQLPRDAARKLVGALAHPLNRAVIDPATNKVVEGYGILQPRVEISIRSAARSRLAAIFSGDTGFDIYARAVSDVYQDLFGEGIFTGKGIYEVEIFQQALEHRFPINSLLSHDLIEGAYARAGLLSDVEVVDDYPSHFSAYSRRKHRWVRGDWQIILWLLPRVPDYFGKIVRNPLSLLSRWEIIDNLRRSVTEFATFVLLLGIWLFFPGDVVYWTLAALAVIAFPTYFQFVVSIARGGAARFTTAFWANFAADFVSANERLFFRITFLCHQGFVTMDAVVRTVIRVAITRRRMLEWETAAEVEIAANKKKSPVETYMEWMPLLSFGIAVVIAAFRPTSLLIALPFLALWASSKPICHWLNQPGRSGVTPLGAKDRVLLRGAALRTWRFFRQYSTAEENWLIPDIVQEAAPFAAHQISTTNLGFLLNARLAAYDLGFVTLREFITTTQKTFETMGRMAKSNGHLYNWYNTRTLEPLTPRFISTVDNGNLVCCLWTLKHGCLEAMNAPIFQEALWRGLEDHLDLAAEFLPKERKNERIAARIEEMKLRTRSKASGDATWLEVVRGLEVDVAMLEMELSEAGVGEEGRWWVHELSLRLHHLGKMVQDFTPWLLPEVAKYLRAFEISHDASISGLTLQSALKANADLRERLKEFLAQPELDAETRAMAESVGARLASAEEICREVSESLEGIAAVAEELAKGMDFGFFYNKRKKAMSIGYDVEHGCLMDYYYDVFASEARAAVFVAVAKGEIPQETWLHLRRPHALYKRTRVILSWTGTMFEYLLPALWMRSYPNTIFERSGQGAVRAQQNFTRKTSVPWGISESSCIDKNPDGFYRYHAFGVPGLAMNRPSSPDLVISPYSTFLGLLVDAAGAAKNLRRMKEMGWLGAYGFFESADFTTSRVGEGKQYELVHCWMAHHQGMSLVAVVNVLCDAPMQRRFHAEPLVEATERLLHEKFSRIWKLEKVDKAVVDAHALLSIEQKQRLAESSSLHGHVGVPGAEGTEPARASVAAASSTAKLAADHHRSDT
ncbi:MAG: glucoamylase family protein [Candidatus Acidiferrales bacterium]